MLKSVVLCWKISPGAVAGLTMKRLVVHSQTASTDLCCMNVIRLYVVPATDAWTKSFSGDKILRWNLSLLKAAVGAFELLSTLRRLINWTALYLNCCPETERKTIYILFRMVDLHPFEEFIIRGHWNMLLADSLFICFFNVKTVVNDKMLPLIFWYYL